MKEFNNLQAFDNFLKKIIANEKLHKAAILEVGAKHIEGEAKRKFGVYQDEIGPYPKWEPLAESTKEDRVRKGFEPDNPLYRTGALMNSIHHKVEGNQAVVGSDEDIMVYQELGTKDIPARPVLGPAAFQSKAALQKLISKAFAAWLTGKKPIKKQETY